MNYKNIVYFIILSLFLVNCNASEEDNNPMHTTTEPPTENHILALGDSYTIGESVAVNERWPVQLKDSLKARGIEISDVKIVARTGWTTGELINAIENQNITGNYELVTLLIGVNNQYRGMDIEIFRTEYIQLLQMAVAFAGNNADKVIVLSIPDWGVTPFAEGRDRDKIAMQIDQYNAIKQQETENAGVEFFEITEISRLAEEDISLIADDGLHPSGKMYSLWVEKVISQVAGLFENQD